MAALFIKYEGRFQVWLYKVGHGMLLLRSTKSEVRQTQIDVLFTNVAAIHIPAVFDDLEIKEIDAGELPVQLGALQVFDRKVYRIVAQNLTGGYVVAGSVVTDESGRDYHEPSPLLNE